MEKNKRGFTLIEVLVVIGIIIALITVAGTAFSGKARRTAVVQECKEIAEAMNEYYHNNGTYPTDLDAFLKDGNYFSDKLKNPYGDGFGYSISGDTIKVYAKPESNGIYYEFKKSQMEVSP